MAVGKQVWGFIQNRDHRVMHRMNSWPAPRWIRFWMLAATRMGDGWLWYSLGAILLAFGGTRGYAAVGAAGSAAILGIFVFKALKQYFLAASIGFSRIVLGMHFLSDVLAGALLGSALGVASIVTFATYGLA